jgi:hypothetical protein
MSAPLLFNDISALSAVLPTLIGAYTWKRQSVALRMIVALSAVSLGVDLLGLLFIWVYGTNIALSNGFLVLQSVLTGLFFINLKEIVPYIRSIFRITFWVMCIVTVIFLISGPFWSGMNKWQLVVSSFFIILFSFLFFYNLVRFELMVPLWYNSSFFAVSGLMMYHASNTGLFLTVDYFQPEVVIKLWLFKLVGYIFLNMLFAIALVKEIKQISGE